MQRTIAHMDLDTFFVSVERKNQPQLIGKPVLVGGTSDRGVVASCSYEARSYGIHSGMSMKLARQLCPEAMIVRGDHEQYSYYSNIITDIIRERVPLYEKTSIDEFYIDLTGMDRFFGCFKYATELRSTIMKETALPISLAMSSNKTVAKIGTGQAKPNGQLEIAVGNEKEFLAPLSIRKIPMVGEKTYSLLRNMGIEKIKTIQEMPLEMMQRVLGENGAVIWRKANGIDHSPLVPYSENKSISTETTFDKDTIDVHYLQQVLINMTESLAYQLRTKKKLTACVTIKIRYSDFNTYTMQCKIPYTAMDHVLIDKVKALFHKLFQKRLLIRLIGIRFSHLVQGSYQFDLFDDMTEKVMLYSAMDKLRDRFGENIIQRASIVGMKKREFLNPFKG
ncbi:MAG: DNA polymerase IV [Chitinophagales bacterium]|jgi:DNA polymerase-4|nr:DNA polymerase IV [Sphingobacteriales bacterium]